MNSALLVLAVALGGSAEAKPSPRTEATPTARSSTGASLSLQPLIDDVLRRNEDLRAYGADEQAAKQRAAAASSFPDPTVGVAIRDLPVPSFSFTEDMMTAAEVRVSQRFPWFGKRSLRKEAGEKVADVSAAHAEASALLLARDTTLAFAELWHTQESRGRILERIAELERLVELVRGRFSAGGARHADLLRAELELARASLPLLTLDEKEARARATLAALLSSTERLEGEAVLPELVEAPSEEELLAALQAHPELRALDVQEERALLEGRLASKDRWPDPEIGVAYGVRVGAPDMVSAELAIPIPLFAGSNQDRLAAASRAEAQGFAQRRAARLSTLVAEVRAAAAAVERERRRSLLFEERLLPTAGRTVDAQLSAWQTGSVDFLSVLEAKLAKFEQELEAIESRASWLGERARLAYAAGSLGFLFPENDLLEEDQR